MMRCHKVDYEIIGTDMQALEVELDPGETVVAEAGAMAWMDDSIDFQAKLGDGSDTNSGFVGKLFGAGKRMMSGESLFMTHFTNEGGTKKRITFAAPYPGHIIPVDMSAVSGLKCQKDAFLCAAYGTKLDLAFHKKLGAGFFGGEGFVLQEIIGDGMAFLHAGGTIVKKELQNERLLVDTGSLVAFTDGINYSIDKSGNMKSMLFGGEGLFLVTLQGTGTVYLQTLPFPNLVDRIAESLPSDK